MPSIVRFGFVLLESMEEGSHKELCKCDDLMGSQELGTQMLKCLFEVHDMARNEVSIKCSSERYLFNWLRTSVSSCFMGQYFEISVSPTISKLFQQENLSSNMGF